MNAWCISSERTHIAVLSAVAQVAVALVLLAEILRDPVGRFDCNGNGP